MRSSRPWLHALLGLALLVQGLAFAAAPLMLAAPEPAAQEQVASEPMPCHGEPADPAPTPACDCCDGDCNAMSACMSGQVAALVAPLAMPLVPAQQAIVAAADRSIESVTPSSRLRPPISFHA
jgi:hypothetical protein